MYNCQKKAIESAEIVELKDQCPFKTFVHCKMFCKVEGLSTMTRDFSEDSRPETIHDAMLRAAADCKTYFLHRCEQLCDFPNSGLRAEEWYAHYRRIYNENEESKRLITKITKMLNDR